MARFDRTIPPGGAGEITLAVQTAKYEGTLHRTAKVFSNDPKRNETVIGLKGEIWTPIKIDPRQVRLWGIGGEEIEGTVQLQATKEDPLELKIDKLSIPDKVDVELLEKEKGRSYQLRLRNKVTVKERYNGKLTLTTNYPDKPSIYINITGDITELVNVNPSVLSFGRISLDRLEEWKNNAAGMTRSVVIKLNKGNDLEIKKVELDKSIFKASAKEVEAGKRAQILVEPVLEKLQKGTNEDLMKIYTNKKGHEVLTVPISFDLL